MKSLIACFLILLFLPFSTNKNNGKPTRDEAIKLLQRYNVPKEKYVIFIDYSKSIKENRLYLLRIQDGKILLESKVSHAFESGKEYATEFSNKIGSKKSCIGVFQTLNSYYGKWGYSMKIKGLDSGINDNAYSRLIVFHASIVDNESWSEGCFMTTKQINKLLIDSTKNGCLIYVYQ